MIWRQCWPIKWQAEAGFFQYINGFYRSGRRHPYLGGVSPLAFEAKMHNENGGQHKNVTSPFYYIGNRERREAAFRHCCERGLTLCRIAGCDVGWPEYNSTTPCGLYAIGSIVGLAVSRIRPLVQIIVKIKQCFILKTRVSVGCFLNLRGLDGGFF